MNCSFLLELLSTQIKLETDMDLAKINEILDAESTMFREALHAVISEAGERRNKLKSQITKSLGLEKTDEMPERHFFTVLDEFEKISGNLGAVLDQAGFDAEVGTAWVAKKKAPKANFRRPTALMLLEVVIDYCVDTRLSHAMYGVLQERGHSLETFESKASIPNSDLLFMRLEDISGYSLLSNRTKNCLKNDDIQLVGELISMSEVQMLRTPNFGRKSLNEVKEILSNINLYFDGLSETEQLQVIAHRALTKNAGLPLVTEWQGDLKPEYAEMDRHERETKTRVGVEIHETVKANSQLIQALKDAGITFKTQLATAPKELLDSICNGHEGWEEQLPRILKGFGHHGYGPQIKLGLIIPPHLNEDVKVYKPV